MTLTYIHVEQMNTGDHRKSPTWWAWIEVPANIASALCGCLRSHWKSPISFNPVDFRSERTLSAGTASASSSLRSCGVFSRGRVNFFLFLAVPAEVAALHYNQLVFTIKNNFFSALDAFRPELGLALRIQSQCFGYPLSRLRWSFPLLIEI